MERSAEYKQMIDSALEQYFKPSGKSWDGLWEAERYSLLSGGKRIRPILVLEFCRACGGDVGAALGAACAVEMVHTYSLIHDDLPCMDNDELRRGKPTNHMVFGECTATLAGDALLADAFAALLDSPIEGPIKLKCALMLAQAAGSSGMCAGQYMDTAASAGASDGEYLIETDRLKTGAMISAACRIGAAAAGAPAAVIDAAGEYGMALGVAFQIRDDVLDAGESTAAGDGKNTYITLLGVEGCRREIARLTERAKDALLPVEDRKFLCDLADSLAVRSI